MKTTGPAWLNSEDCYLVPGHLLENIWQVGQRLAGKTLQPGEGYELSKLLLEAGLMTLSESNRIEWKGGES